jgi:Kef-type K+ transport system membrane component KefB
MIGFPMANTTGSEQLLLQLFVIFVAAKLVGEVFEWMKLPAVPGEILAGFALGPYAWGRIPASDTLHSIAEIGVIFVLFSAGLETSPSELIRVSRKALLVSVAGVVAPFVLGFVLGPLMEENFRRAMYLSRGDPMVFVERPISALLLALALALLVILILPAIRAKREEVFRE